jgi:hypothetical protein
MERNTRTIRVRGWWLAAIALQLALPAWTHPGNVNGQSLVSQSGPTEPNFAAYYEPWESEIEPNAISYELPLDLSTLANYDRVNQLLGIDAVKDLVIENGFAIIEHEFGEEDPDRDDIVSPYTYLRDRNLPMFVTADTLLHVYLRLDALRLYDQLEGDLQEAARRNVAYLAVASRLLGSDSAVPAMVSDEVSSELAKIEAHQGFAPSDIFVYLEDYSQYVPRGHYTRSEILKRYFKTLMWYGRMAFLLKGHENWGLFGEALISPHDAKIQTLQACLLAISLNSQQVDQRSAREIWDRMYAVTALYVGLADDLTPYDYLWVLDRTLGPDYALADLDDPSRLHELKTELALLPSPQIFGGTGGGRVMPPLTEETLNEILDKTKGMRLMGQRFIPDSYMFQNLVASRTGEYVGEVNGLPFTAVITPAGILRGYPRGLDVMALLGSEQAREILIQEGDTAYQHYWDRLNELAAQFGAFGQADWNRNLYWGWLYSLRVLIVDYGDGYPAFMQTRAWSRRCLNASLASWTELRHDTILYAKQGYSEGPFSEKPAPTCYVEPVPKFYGRFLALTQMTIRGLRDLDVLSTRGEQDLRWYEDLLGRLVEIANKELTNQELSSEDWHFLDRVGDYLEPFTDIGQAGAKTTLVADVHTDTNEERVLEEGVGKVDLIVVACPQPDGSVFLATGPVLSYYEFTHPMSDRLTDEGWREILDSPNKPERPRWYQSLMH